MKDKKKQNKKQKKQKHKKQNQTIFRIRLDKHESPWRIFSRLKLAQCSIADDFNRRNCTCILTIYRHYPPYGLSFEQLSLIKLPPWFWRKRFLIFVNLFSLHAAINSPWKRAWLFIWNKGTWNWTLALYLYVYFN